MTNETKQRITRELAEKVLRTKWRYDAYGTHAKVEVWTDDGWMPFDPWTSMDDAILLLVGVRATMDIGGNRSGCVLWEKTMVLEGATADTPNAAIILAVCKARDINTEGAE